MKAQKEGIKMDYQSFEGQEAFFNDYQRVAKAGYQEEEVIDDVLQQLNQQLTADQLIYRVEAEKTKDGEVFLFPFSKFMYTEDLDAAISTEFRYDGAPYVYETYEDEQP